MTQLKFLPSRFDVIPYLEPRHNTLIMKAYQDPDGRMHPDCWHNTFLVLYGSAYDPTWKNHWLTPRKPLHSQAVAAPQGDSGNSVSHSTVSPHGTHGTPRKQLDSQRVTDVRVHEPNKIHIIPPPPPTSYRGDSLPQGTWGQIMKYQITAGKDRYGSHRQ